MVHSKDYIDVTLFQSLDHEVLAQHVIPDTFEGAGDKAYAARKDCAEKVTEYFKTNLSLNVKLAPKNWKTKHFCMMVGRKVLTKPMAVARCNLASSSHCILYCEDCCESEEKKCSPIAKVLFSFSGKSTKKTIVSGTVEWLFFHNCHDWKLRNDTLCLAGCCLIPTPVEFIARETYDDSFAAARELLHIEKGVLDGSELGVKKDVPEKELPFEYIRREYPRNFAYMPFSNENADNWQKKKTRHAFQKFVDPAAHKSCIVRLFYCVSNLIGLGSIATPFEYEYDDRMKVVGSVRNRKHNLFAQEESVIVGGFVYGNEKENQIRHTAHDNVSMHRPFNPLINNGQDAGSCHEYGFAVITSLLRGEERVIYAGRNDAEIVIPYNMSLVLRGNFPHGGVTHCVNDNCDLVWPALHAYLDMFTCPRGPFVTGDVPTGYGTLDSDDELADSVGNTEDDIAIAHNVSAAADDGTDTEESDVNDVTDGKGSDGSGASNTEDEEDAEDDGGIAGEEPVCDSEDDEMSESSSDADEDVEPVEDVVDNEESTALSNDTISNHGSKSEETEHAPEQETSSKEEDDSDQHIESVEEHVSEQENPTGKEDAAEQIPKSIDEHAHRYEIRSEEEASERNLDSDEKHGPEQETRSEKEDVAEQISESFDEHVNQHEILSEKQHATEQTSASKKKKRKRKRKNKRKSAVLDKGNRKKNRK